MSDDTPEPVPSPVPSIGPAFLFIIGAAILSAFVAIWGVQYVGREREKVLVARVDSLRTALAGAERTRTRARNLSMNSELEAQQAHEAIDSSERDELKQAGLSDPVHDLKADLQLHRELIPYPGVLGGTMGFYSDEDIRILGPRWVFARFEDGHIGGVMLLEYRVSGGKITWRRLAAAKGD